MLRTKSPVPASCPVVCSRALLSARSAKDSSSLSRMPQTNKSKNNPASDTSGSAQASGDTEPVSREESRAAGDAGGGGGGEEREDNVGDSEIIKSPSDPKQYR